MDARPLSLDALDYVQWRRIFPRGQWTYADSQGETKVHEVERTQSQFGGSLLGLLSLDIPFDDQQKNKLTIDVNAGVVGQSSQTGPNDKLINNVATGTGSGTLTFSFAPGVRTLNTFAQAAAAVARKPECRAIRSGLECI